MACHLCHSEIQMKMSNEHTHTQIKSVCFIDYKNNESEEFINKQNVN